MDAISQQIMDAIGTRLAGITIANGYASNAGNSVFADRVTPFIETELPGIMYRDPDEDEEALTMGYKHLTMKVEIEAFAYGPTAPKEVRNKLVADVKKAVRVDLSWGGLALDTRITGRSMQIEHMERLIASAVIRLEIDYREAA